MSLFIGGLARIDYISHEVSRENEYSTPIRYTIFCSDHLPITMVQIEDADYFYKKVNKKLDRILFG
jgi:hypothetical protein